VTMDAVQTAAVIAFLQECYEFMESGKEELISQNTDYKTKAYEFAVQKIRQFNELYGYQIGKVTIKNQKTMWGSCSKKGNINLNYKILFLPERMAEYIVVHELCHIQEQNHSAKFWDLVTKTFPDHKALRKQFRKRDFS